MPSICCNTPITIIELWGWRSGVTRSRSLHSLERDAPGLAVHTQACILVCALSLLVPVALFLYKHPFQCRNLDLRRTEFTRLLQCLPYSVLSTQADKHQQQGGRCSRLQRDRRGRVVGPPFLLLAAAAAAPRAAPTKTAALAAVVDSSSLPLLAAAGLVLWPWPRSLRNRRGRCSLGAFLAALLSSAPRKLVLVLLSW